MKDVEKCLIYMHSYLIYIFLFNFYLSVFVCVCKCPFMNEFMRISKSGMGFIAFILLKKTGALYFS